MHNDSEITTPQFLSGGGKMGELVRQFNWSATTLGAPENWEQSLKTSVSICLNSNFPIALYWGEDLVLIYNDAWSSIPGGKHPWALGHTAKEVWPDIWTAIEPDFKKALGGEPGGSKDALLPMERHGYVEECYFDFTFTPVYGDKGKVNGVFNAVIETSYRVINERRNSFLTGLSLRLMNSVSSTEIFEKQKDYFKENNIPISFAITYSYHNGSSQFIGSTFADAENDVGLKQTLPFKEIVGSSGLFFIENLADFFTKIPKGHWPEAPKEGVALLIRDSNAVVTHIIFCGLSARLRYDEQYRQFLQSIETLVSNFLTGIHALDEERKRTQALEELDKSKTVFFSNISHEFRTPITLMLGPVEEILNSTTSTLNVKEKQNLEATHRNAMRLLKLVNSLLDFSRIEGGRQMAHYILTDLPAFTKNLASNFRSVIEAAKLKFIVQADEFIKPVYVDRQMWEKIVFNLLSNAFKYTLEGTISLKLFSENNNAVLQVEDTGVGIPENELPKMFNRFHRAQNVVGRSFEGTGIGLSLIKELINLHNGTISVHSTEKKGSMFTVTIPFGKTHLPSTQTFEEESDFNESISTSFISEADSLLESVTTIQIENETQKLHEHTILVVDDNADMRQHLQSLLKGRYNVQTAANGMQALQKVEALKPQLILSDIMMPIMDGIQLVNEVKNSTQLRSIPVILLTARAGEESRIEGLTTGADDYIVKPFSANELLSRISSQISISQRRQEVEKRLEAFLKQAPAAIALVEGNDLIYTFANPFYQRIHSRNEEQLLGKKVKDVFPELQGQGVYEIFETVFKTGETFNGHEFPGTLFQNGTLQTRYYDFILHPIKDVNSSVTHVMIHMYDITESVLLRKQIEESETRFRVLIETLPQMVWVTDSQGTQQFVSKRWEEYSGIQPTGMETWALILHPDDMPVIGEKWGESLKTGTLYNVEVRLKDKVGNYRWHTGHGTPVFDHDKNITNWIGSFTDIHTQKEFAESLEKSVQERTKALSDTNVHLENSQSSLQQLIDSSVEFISLIDKDLNYITVNKRFENSMGIRKQDLVGRNLFDVNPKAKNTIYHDHIIDALKSGVTKHIDKRKSSALEHIIIDTYLVPYYLQGKVEGVIIMARDVTDIFKSELDLEDKNKQLEKMNRELESFNYVASHDLQEPLRKIQAFINMLEMNIDNSEKREKYIEKIQSSAERMSNLIRSILNYNTLSSTNQNFEKVDLKKLIHDIELDYELILADKKAKIVLQDELGIVEAIPSQLSQLFSNLISNSLKFSERAPVITIQSKKSGSKEKGDERLQLILSDNGIGFEAKYASKVFELFQRLHPVSVYAGSGIGLSTVRRIVENHKGKITVDSEPGKGTVFTIELPFEQHFIITN